MRGHVIGASMTSALLSCGVISALAARTSESDGRFASTERTASAASVAELRSSIEVLRNRVSNLELELSKARSANRQGVPTIIKAPFWVHDEKDKPILWVMPDHTVKMFSNKGLLEIGPGVAGDYGILIKTDSGKPTVGIGTVKAGHGVVQVNK